MAFDTYLEIATVKGESTDEKHKEWIEVMSFSHGVTQSGSGSIASHGARTTGKCDHHDFTITKRLDKSSPHLIKHVCNGKHFDKVVVEICRNTGKKEVFMKYIFEHVVVTSSQIGGGFGQENPVETVSFGYAKIKWEFNVFDPKTGAKQSTVPAEWDVLKNVGA